MTKAIDLENEYLTSDEVSDWLKVSRRTLHRWARLRKGPPSVKVGRSVYYRRTSVEQWLLALEQSHTGACSDGGQ
ncbi:helix-turn-helix transcriptional regulator [Croceibacterium atlanticum]|uniref:helix-turn-helix transcriptional regulator n=1 Tax=Croceibacterium atlanticum TaxID=1267766 RepID=UPI001C54DE4C